MDHDPHFKTSSNQFPENSEANMDSPSFRGNSKKVSNQLIHQIYSEIKCSGLRPSPWLPLVIAAFLFLFLFCWFLECPCGPMETDKSLALAEEKSRNKTGFHHPIHQTFRMLTENQWNDDRNWFDCCSNLLFIPFFLVLLNSQPKSFIWSWKPLQFTWTFIKSSSSCFFDFFFFLYSSRK